MGVKWGYRQIHIYARVRHIGYLVDLYLPAKVVFGSVRLSACLLVSLSVSLSATFLKKGWTDFDELLIWKGGMGPKEPAVI